MATKPNILFIHTDQQRPDWLEMNPDIPVRTPHLRQLSARGRWLTNAVCPAPLCAPSRACLVAGQQYDRTQVWGNDTYAPDGLPRYHLRLRDEAGYHVMAVGKHHVGNNQSGIPPKLHRGVDGRQGLRAWGFSDAIFNAGLNQATILMRRHDMVPQDTYMTFLHQRGLAEQHMADYERRNQEGVWTATFPTTLPDDAYFDSWITQNALILNTVVIFTSDHGEMLGDYNQWQKVSPLQASVGVPLVVAGPGVSHREADDAPMTTLDLTASFLEWAGLTPASELDSRSLVGYLQGATESHRQVVFSGLSAWRMAFDGRFKLVRGYDPDKRVGGDRFEPHHMSADETARCHRERPQLLFDLQQNERVDVSAQHADVLAHLHAALDDHLALRGDDDRSGQSKVGIV